MKRSVVHNASYMTVASIAQKVIAFLYFTLIARFIGAEGTGQYFFALSFTTIFVVFVDLGLTNVFIREAAQSKERVGKYLSAILSMKVALGVLSYAVMVMVMHLLGYEGELRTLIYLSGITMLFDSFHLSLYGSLRALGDLKYEAWATIGSQLLTLILGSFFLFQGYPLIFLILAFTISSACNVCFAVWVLRSRYQIGIVPRADQKIIKPFLKIAAPFAVAAVLARLYSYADTMILKQVVGDIAVGWYSIAYKITFAFQFIPLALVAALYPSFSTYFKNEKEKLASTFEYGLLYLFLIAAPIAVGIGVLAQDIIITIYTAEYMNAVLPLQILISSIVFSFLSFPIGALLNACHRQTAQTCVVATALLVNVGLNLWLIPSHGVVGAAIAALVGNATLAIGGWFFVPSIVSVRYRWLISRAFGVMSSAAVMGALVMWVNTFAHFTLAIVVGAVSYGLLLFVTKTITMSTIADAKALISR